MRLPHCNCCCNTNINLEARKIFKQKREKGESLHPETRACGFSIACIQAHIYPTISPIPSPDLEMHNGCRYIYILICTLMTGALIYVRLQKGGIPTFWAIMCVIAIEDCRSDGVLHLESAI